jgi:hypothetical protein
LVPVDEEKDVAVEQKEEATWVFAVAGSTERALLARLKLLLLTGVRWKHFSGDGVCLTTIVRHQNHMTVRGR